MPTDSSPNLKDALAQNISAFCNLTVLIADFENELQAVREAMTLRTDFHPENLFNHLSMGHSEITRAHLIALMDKNSRTLTEQEIRIILGLYGYKDRLSYKDFLNYVYPHDVEALKTISTQLFKKYMKNQKTRVSEQLLALFIILVEKQIEFIHALQEAKNKLLPAASRESVKRLVRQIKYSVPQKPTGVHNDFVLTFQELKSVLKKQRNLVDNKCLPICRRLSAQKHSFIGLEQLEFWLRPWRKLKDKEDCGERKQTLAEDIQSSYG